MFTSEPPGKLLHEGMYVLVAQCIRLCYPWTVVCQASLSMGFSRPQYQSGLLFTSPGDLPEPGIEPVSPMSPVLQANSLPTEPLGKPCMKVRCILYKDPVFIHSIFYL